MNFYRWDTPDGTKFSAEARLYQAGSLTHEDETSFDIDLMVGDAATVDDVQAFFSRSYEALGCVPDRHNND